VFAGWRSSVFPSHHGEKIDPRGRGFPADLCVGLVAQLLERCNDLALDQIGMGGILRQRVDDGDQLCLAVSRPLIMACPTCPDPIRTVTRVAETSPT
jgi:hypothetical protein